MLTIKISQIKCPQCGDNNTEIIDDGIKWYLRKLILNNRYACRKCNITWRKKIPANYLVLKEKA